MVQLTMKNLAGIAGIGITSFVIAVPVNAATLFFGEDINPVSGLNTVPPLTGNTPNSDAARDSFLANLTGVGTESFESFTVGASSPADLVFPGAGTATLSGNGEVSQRTDSGVFPITGSNYWLTFVGDGGLEINFSDPVAAFGFYLADLETTKLALNIGLANGGSDQIVVDNTTAPGIGQNSGSVFYTGILVDDASELISSVEFAFAGGGNGGDGVALDNLTIGSLDQIIAPPPPSQSIPESASLLGFLVVGTAVASGVIQKKAA